MNLLDTLRNAKEALEVLGHKGDTRSGNAITNLTAAIEMLEKQQPDTIDGVSVDSIRGYMKYQAEKIAMLTDEIDRMKK